MCRRSKVDKFDFLKLPPISYDCGHTKIHAFLGTPAKTVYSFYYSRILQKETPMIRFLFTLFQLGLVGKRSKALLFLVLGLSFSLTLNAQIIDFETEPSWVDGSTHENGAVYTNGNIRLTDNGSSWLEDINTANGTNVIISQASADGSTITVETIDGTELDFQSFTTRDFGGGDIVQIEGFRDALSTGVQTMSVSSGGAESLIFLDNSIFNNVDQMVITSGVGGFQQSFDNLTFGPVPTPPTVNSNAATNVEEITTTLNGEVVNDGGSTITERGFLYALTADDADPMIGDTDVIQQTVAGTTGVFSLNATGLAAASGYSFRAYAINSEGTTLGTVLTFTTIAITNPTIDTNLGISLNEGLTANITITQLSSSDAAQGASELSYTVQASSIVNNGTLFIDGDSDGSFDGGALDTDISSANSTFTEQNIIDGDIYYEHDGTETISDGFDFVVSDGTGGTTGSTSFVITITLQNDVPVIADLNGDASVYDEGDGQVIVDQGTLATLSDDDLPTDFDGGNLTVTVSSGGNAAEDLLSLSTAGNVTLDGTNATDVVRVSAVSVGTLMNTITEGNDLIINFNAGATLARVEELIQAITYENTNLGNPTTGAHTFRITVDDGDGSGQSADNEVIFTVQGINDNPVASVNAGSSLNQGATDIVLQTELEFTDAEQAAANVTYTLDNTTSNGTLRNNVTTLIAGSTFTQADINAGDINYEHDGVGSTTDSFQFDVTDGVGGAVNNVVFNFTISDVTAASISEAQYLDIDSDGQIDRVDVTFSESIAGSTFDASDWNFATNPDGLTVMSGVIVGTDVQITVGGTVANTTVIDPTTTVQYTNNANRITDGTNPSVTSGEIVLDDGAVPLFLNAIQLDTDGNGDIDEIVVELTEPFNNTTLDQGDFNLPVGSTVDGIFDNDVVNTGNTIDNDNDRFFTLEVSVLGTGAVILAHISDGDLLILEDASGNAAADNAGINSTDQADPIIIATSALDASNSFLDITFSEGIFSSAGGPVLTTDFDPGFVVNTGTALGLDIIFLNTLAGADLVGGESQIRFGLGQQGSSNGNETIQISPNASAIEDAADNPLDAGQMTQMRTLNALNILTIVDVSIDANNAFVDVTFSESVERNRDAPNDNDPVGYANNLEFFAMDFNDPDAIGAVTFNPNVITITNQAGGTLTNADNILRFNFNAAFTGVPSGNETFNISNRLTDRVRGSVTNVLLPAGTDIPITLNDERTMILSARYLDTDGNGNIDKVVIEADQNIEDARINSNIPNFTFEGSSPLAQTNNAVVAAFVDFPDPGVANDEFITFDVNITGTETNLIASYTPGDLRNTSLGLVAANADITRIDLASPVIESAVALSNTMIRLQYGEDIQAPILFNDGFSISGATVTNVALNGSDPSIVEITVSGLGATDYTGTLSIVIDGNDLLEDAAGNDIADLVGFAVGDGQLPTVLNVVSIDANADGNVDGLEIEFSEPIDDSDISGGDLSDWSVSTDNFAIEIDAINAFTTSVGGTNVVDDEFVTLSFTPNLTSGTGVFEFRYQNDGPNDITDLSAASVNVLQDINITPATDGANPVFTFVNPIDGATNVTVASVLNVLTFELSEPATANAGTFINLFANAAPLESIELNSSAIDVTGTTVNVSLSNLLQEGISYNVSIDENAFSDALLNNSAIDARWNWDMEPVGQPNIVAGFPTGADVPLNSLVQIIFDESVRYANFDESTGNPNFDATVTISVVSGIDGNFPRTFSTLSGNNGLEDPVFFPRSNTELTNGAGSEDVDNTTTINDTITIDLSQSIMPVSFASNVTYEVTIGEAAFEFAGSSTDTQPFSFQFSTVNDGTPPTLVGNGIVSFEPDDQADGDFTGNVDPATTNFLDVFFNEDIEAGTGNIQLFLDSDNDLTADAIVFDIPSNDPSVSYDLTNDRLRIDLTVTGLDISLTGNVTYYINIENGAVQDLSGNSFAGFNDATTWNFSTQIETIAQGNEPVLESLNPADNANNVAVTSSFVLEFDEPITVGTTEEVRFLLFNNDALIETIQASALSVNNNLVTIDFPGDLSGGTNYYITVEEGAIRDFSGNLYDGFTSKIAWNFNTEVGNDMIDPIITAIDPIDGATAISLSPTITITFDAPVFANTGDFRITDGAIFNESIDVNSSEVVIDGNELTFTPTSSLTSNTTYNIDWDQDVVTDAAGNGLNLAATYIGVITGGVWDFTTVQDLDAPQILVLDPENDELNVTADGTFTMTIDFNEPVNLGAGNIQIFYNDGSTLVEGQTFNVLTDVTLSNGNTRAELTVGPLDGSTEYFVGIPANSFVDLASTPNNFSGILPNGIYSFVTTGDASLPLLVNNFVSATDPTGNINLVFEFNERVTAIPGGDVFIEFDDADNTEVFRVASTSVTPNNNTNEEGSTFTFSIPANTLKGGNTYNIGIENVAFEDASGNNYAGLLADGTFSFTTTDDNTAPIVDLFDPLDGEPNVALNSNLTITFDEPVTPVVGGMLNILFASSGQIVEAIPVGSAVASVSNTVYTFNPTNDFEGNTELIVQVTANAFEDNDGTPNGFAGILDQTTWNFTTSGGGNIPTATLSPLDGATGFDLRGNLVLTFNEPVFVNTGNLTIAGGANGDVVIPITDVTQITGNGTTTITVDPVEDLFGGVVYTITLDIGALIDASNNNYDLSAVGEAGVDGWTFTTQTGILINNGTIGVSPSFSTCIDQEFILQGTSQDAIIIGESNVDDIRDVGSTETIVLSLGSGFLFNTLTAPSISNLNATGDLSGLGIAITDASTLQISYTSDAVADEIDRIRISGLEIRNTTGDLTTTATLIRSGGSADLYGNNVSHEISHLNLMVESVDAPLLGNGITAGTFNLVNVTVCEDNRVSGTANAITDFDIDAIPLSANHSFRWYAADGTTVLLTQNNNVGPTFAQLAIDQTTPGDQVRFVSQVNENGCESELTSFVVTVLASPDPADFVGLDQQACNNDEVTIGDDGNGSTSISSFLWTSADDTDFGAPENDDANPVFTPLANTSFLAGVVRNYALVVTDNQGCVSDATDPNRIVSVTLPRRVNPGLTSTAGTTSFSEDNSVGIEIRGSNPNPAILTGSFEGPGLGSFDFSGNPATAQFVPSAAGVGTHVISYSLTSVALGCVETQSQTVTVSIGATDIFDAMTPNLEEICLDVGLITPIRSNAASIAAAAGSFVRFEGLGLSTVDNVIYTLDPVAAFNAASAVAGVPFREVVISRIVDNGTPGDATDDFPDGTAVVQIFPDPVVEITSIGSDASNSIFCDSNANIEIVGTVSYSDALANPLTVNSFNIEKIASSLTDPGNNVGNDVDIMNDEIDFGTLVSNPLLGLVIGESNATYRITVTSVPADNPIGVSLGCIATATADFVLVRTPERPTLRSILDESGTRNFVTGNQVEFEFCDNEIPIGFRARNLLGTRANVSWFSDSGLTDELSSDGNVSGSDLGLTAPASADFLTSDYFVTQTFSPTPVFEGCVSPALEIDVTIYRTNNTPDLIVDGVSSAPPADPAEGSRTNTQLLADGTILLEYCVGDNILDLNIDASTIIDQASGSFPNTFTGVNRFYPDDGTGNPDLTNPFTSSTLTAAMLTDPTGLINLSTTSANSVNIWFSQVDYPTGLGNGAFQFDGCETELRMITIDVKEAPEDIVTAEGFTTEYFTCPGDEIEPIRTEDESGIIYTWYEDNGDFLFNAGDNFIVERNNLQNADIVGRGTGVNTGGGYDENVPDTYYFWVTRKADRSLITLFDGCESTPTLIAVTVFGDQQAPVFDGFIDGGTGLATSVELNFSVDEITTANVFSATSNYLGGDFVTNAESTVDTATMVFNWFNSDASGAAIQPIITADANGSQITASEMQLVGLSNDDVRYFLLTQTTDIISTKGAGSTTLFDGCESIGTLIRVNLFGIPPAPEELNELEVAFHCLEDVIDDHIFRGEEGATFYLYADINNVGQVSNRIELAFEPDVTPDPLSSLARLTFADLIEADERIGMTPANVSVAGRHDYFITQVSDIDPLTNPPFGGSESLPVEFELVFLDETEIPDIEDPAPICRQDGANTPVVINVENAGLGDVIVWFDEPNMDPFLDRGDAIAVTAFPNEDLIAGPSLTMNDTTTFYVYRISNVDIDNDDFPGCPSAETSVEAVVFQVPETPDVVGNAGPSEPNSYFFCQNDNVEIATIDIENPVPGSVYNWFAEDPSLVDNPTSFTSGSSITFEQVAVNTALDIDIVQSVTIFVVQENNPICDSPPREVTITVNPQPDLGLVNLDTNESFGEGNQLFCFDAGVLTFRATNDDDFIIAQDITITSIDTTFTGTINGFDYNPSTGEVTMDPAVVSMSTGGTAIGDPQSFVITAFFEDDNSCADMKEFSITISPQPELIIRNSNGTPATVVACEGEVLSYEAVANGIPVVNNVAYTLNGNLIPTFDGVIVIDPILLIVDDPETTTIESNTLLLDFFSDVAPFCNNIASIEIVVNPLPVVFEFEDPVFEGLNFVEVIKACQEDSVILRANVDLTGGLGLDDFTYRWSFEGDVIVGADSSLLVDIVPRESELFEYGLTLINNTTGCSNNFNSVLQILPVPDPSFSFVGETVGQEIRFEFREDSGILEELIEERTLRLQDVANGLDDIIDIGEDIEYENEAFDNAGIVTASLDVINVTGCRNVVTRTINVLDSIFVDSDGFFEGFENGANGWFTDNVLFNDRFKDQVDPARTSSWQLGQPSGAVINSAADGTNAWVTNLSGNYNSSENSFLYSPTFNLSNIDKPTISFDRFIHFVDDQGTDETSDGVVIQFSFDDGRSWVELGEVSEDNSEASGINWYNRFFISGFSIDPLIDPNSGWTQASGEGVWKESVHVLSLGEGNERVRFRIALATNADSEAEGFGFDNFRIFNRDRVSVLETFSSLLNDLSRVANDSTFQTLDNPDNVLRDDVLWLNYFNDFNNDAINQRVDPINDRDNITPSTLSTDYGINKVPRAVINGMVQKEVTEESNINVAEEISGWSVATLSNSSLSAPLVSITIDSIETNANDRIELSIGVSSRTDFDDNVELTTKVFIVEREIDANLLNQLLVDISLTGPVHNVVRESLPDPLGFEFVGSLNDQDLIGNYNVTWEVNSVFHPDRLRAVVYVQRGNDDGSSTILQSGFLDLSPKRNVVTGIEEQFLSGQDVAIYPNPSSDLVKVVFNQEIRNEANLRLIDQTGKILKTQELSVGTKEVPIATNDLAAGVYFISVANERGKLKPRRLVIIRE